MFILPTRSRPGNLARFAEAYRETGAGAPVCILLDSDDPNLRDYYALNVPATWVFICASRAAVPDRINEAFRIFPSAAWYGLLGDDVVPRTPRWDQILAEAAGSWGVSYGDDGIQGEKLCTHPVIGGELARALGWLCLPGLDFLYVDTTLFEIGRRLGTLRYLADVSLEHMHPSVGKAPWDAVYDHNQSGCQDRLRFEAWQIGKAAGLIERLNIKRKQGGQL